MTIDYETYIKEEDYAPPAERSRYQHLRGSVRRAPAETAGKGGVDTRRCSRRNRCAKEKYLQLGSGYQCSATRYFPNFSGGLRRKRPCSYARKIIFQFLEYPLLPFSNFWNIISPVLTYGVEILTRTVYALLPDSVVLAHKRMRGNGAIFMT